MKRISIPGKAPLTSCLLAFALVLALAARSHAQGNREKTVASTTGEITGLEREAHYYDYWAKKLQETAQQWHEDAEKMRAIAEKNHSKEGFEIADEDERRAKEIAAEAERYRKKAEAKAQEAQQLKSQLPSTDLTGLWQDATHGITVRIVQSGFHVAMDLGNGIALPGKLTGRNLKLSYKWTAEDAAKHVKSENESGPQGAADRAAALKALVGKVVNLTGTVSEDGGSIDGTYDENWTADAESSTGTGTQTHTEAPRGAPIRLLKKQSQPHCSSKTAEEFPEDRSRTRLGVGEEVTVTFSGDTSSGAAPQWKLLGSGSLSATSGNEVTFTAGDSAGAASITAQTSPGQSCSILFTVVEPDGTILRRVEGTEHHVQGTLVADFLAQVFVTPDDVSFYRTGIREQEVCCKYEGDKDYASSFQGQGHHPNPDFLPMKRRDSSTEGLGTRMSGCDNIGSQITGPKDKLLKLNGKITHEIPQEYIVAGSSRPARTFTMEVQWQEFKNGTIRIAKAGTEPLSANIDDPSTTTTEMARWSKCENFK